MIVAVIGLGTFGANTAISLYEKGAEVIALDKNEDLVEKIKDRVTHAVTADVTDERSLRSINISDVDVAVVAIGDNVETSILAVAMLRKLGVGRVIARATTTIHEHVLREVGASEITKIEEEMGEFIASKIVAPHVLQRYSFTPGYSLVELVLTQDFAGKTVVETGIRQNYDLNVVAIKKRVPTINDEGKSSFRIEVRDKINPMDEIESDDIVVIVGSDKNLNKLFEDLQD